jgi:hypothetical protein
MLGSACIPCEAKRPYQRVIHMAAKLVRLKPGGDKLREEQAARLRQLVLGFPEAPPDAISRVLAAIDRETAARNGWTFVMLSPDQNRAVVGWLCEHSRRPKVALLLWSELFVHLDADSGHIDASRDELAEAVNTSPDEISEVMSELVRIGAVTRWYEKVPGLRGRGMVRYAMNPHVATKLPGAARVEAQKMHAPVRLVPAG